MSAPLLFLPTGADGGWRLASSAPQIIIRWPSYGCRRVTAQLRRDGWTVNSKVVRRMVHELGVQVGVGLGRRHTTDSDHGLPRDPNLVGSRQATRPDAGWCADITDLRLGQRFIYLAVILDVFSRAVRGWHLGLTLGQELTLTALYRARAQHTPAIHHSDQGMQYASHAYIAALGRRGVPISRAAFGQPTQNAVAERFIRTLKEEYIDDTEYHGFADARRRLKQWFEVAYTWERIHSALNYATPAEHEANYWKRQGRSPSIERCFPAQDGGRTTCIPYDW